MRHPSRGFTLIELVVTMALIAVLLAIAAPNFVTFQRNSQLTSTANSFIASMATARAEAMKRNHDAYVVPDFRNGCNAGWTCGWYVFVDMNKDGAFVASDGDILIAEQAAPPSAILTPANANVSQFSDGTSKYVLYNGSGFPKLRSGSFAPQSLDFSYGTATYGPTARRVISSIAGRMWVCTPASASDTICTQVNQ